MEAVRMRKESQIYNADERRALGVLHRVEKEKREYEVIQQFRNMVNTKIAERQTKSEQIKAKEQKVLSTSQQIKKAKT